MIHKSCLLPQQQYDMIELMCRGSFHYNDDASDDGDANYGDASDEDVASDDGDASDDDASDDGDASADDVTIMMGITILL